MSLPLTAGLVCLIIGPSVPLGDAGDTFQGPVRVKSIVLTVGRPLPV